MVSALNNRRTGAARRLWSWSLALNAADGLHRRLDALGILVPELRELRRVHIFDLVADIGDDGLELVALGDGADVGTQFIDRDVRGALRGKNADPQRELDVVAGLLERRD